METYGLPESGYRVFLDRFARKDVERKTLAAGDFVLAIPDRTNGHRVIARIIEKNDHTVIVETGHNGSSKRITLPLDSIDKPLETSPSEMHQRVAKAVSSVERDPGVWEPKFVELMQYFVPGGRILAAAGVEEKLTCFNCSVVDSPSDDITGIFKSADLLADILRRGGGVGFPLSRLRPRGSHVKTVNGRASGPVSWSTIYSATAGLIEQGGSRKGALMLILDDWHPDIEEFIHSKRSMQFNVNCNQSIAISDTFMRAVQDDLEWQLVFPIISHPNYDKDWDGNIDLWRARYPDAVTVHKTMRAKDLWKQIVDSAHASGEPGLWFKDRSNSLSNSYYYGEGYLSCTNPCGEQPLPRNGMCNLGHLILPRFVEGPIGNAKINWDSLAKYTSLAVRFLDDIIDYTHYFTEESKQQQLNERRVGLGTLGLAEALIRCGIKYGADKQCLSFLDKLYAHIAESAYMASVELAKEKGVFKWFNADKFLRSGFMQSMPDRVRGAIHTSGLRNVTLLTQAPCGTVGTYLGTSTGIEPFFDLEWTRDCRAGVFAERAVIVDEYRAQNPSSKELPSYFVTAMMMTPADHAHTQAAIQRWVDSAISKTSNLPADYTPEQVGEFYKLMYDLGCKGGTVYRDGSRDQQVLRASTVPAVHVPKVIDLPDVMNAKKAKVQSPMGHMHVTISYDEQNEPRESFCAVGKGGSDVYADMEGLNRLISLILRLNSPVPPHERLELVIETLQGIGGRHSTGFGPDRVLSLPDALSKAIELIQGHSDRKSLTDLCPQCGGGRFASTEGCHTCLDCGHSLC